MECVYCKGKLNKSSAPFTLERSDYQIHWLCDKMSSHSPFLR